MEFADTCKIRVIDNDETYAIDEVSSFHSRAARPVFSVLIQLAVLLLLLYIWQGGHQCPQDPGRRCIIRRPVRQRCAKPA